jgi:hypothetical protein
MSPGQPTALCMSDGIVASAFAPTPITSATASGAAWVAAVSLRVQITSN